MTKWRKSSRSNTSGGQCVEVASFVGNIGVQNSKDPDGPRLALSPDASRGVVRGFFVLGLGAARWCPGSYVQVDGQVIGYEDFRR